MRPWMIGFGVLVLVIAASAGGFWIGQRQHEPASALERRVLYYRNPMGQPDVSAVPKKDSMGMDYIPVYADQAPAAPPQNTIANAERRVLYYRNPMGQPDTSPAPKKDSMGMDYIPVYEGDEANGAGVVKIDPGRIQQLGVRSEPVEMRALARMIQSVGTVQADERQLSVVNTKFDGWIEKLDVNATGQAVRTAARGGIAATTTQLGHFRRSDSAALTRGDDHQNPHLALSHRWNRAGKNGGGGPALHARRAALPDR